MKRKYGMYFSDFMKAVRTGKNVTLEQLGWGICSVSMMNRIEEGKRLPEKMTRDRLLERLGVANDGYEDYLQPDEYARWTTRQDLLFAIENDEPDRAWRMIRQYEENARSGNAIESQFYLAMKVQLMRRQEAMEEELRTVLQRAIACTMPEYHMRQWKKCLLSGQEWNLLLEFIHSGGDVGQVAESSWRDSYKAMAYEALLEAVQESGMDIYSRARIGSKAAYYLCAELMKKTGEVWDCERLFRISASAVEVLRSTERMYYLSELLEIEEQALVLLSRELGTVPGSIRELLSTLEQVREWRKVLSQVYRDGGVPERMENDCYLYWQTQNYCYGDVVFLYCKGNDLFQYNYKRKESEKILNFLSYGISAGDIQYLYMNSGLIEVIDNYDTLATSEYVTIQEGESPEITVTLGVMSTTKRLESIIADYNRVTKDVRIELKQYDLYDDYRKGLEQLKLDLISGKAPDIINISPISIDAFITKDVFADLYNFMDIDSSFAREMLLESVRKAYEYDGHLYSMGASFQLYTIWGADSIVNGQQGVSMEKMIQILENKGKTINAIFWLFCG